MPFKSDKQRKWMHANQPEMAKKWEKEEKNEGNIGITTKKGKSIELTHKTSGKEIVVQNTPSVLKKYAKMGYLISMPEGKLNEAKFKDIDVKKLGKKKTNDLMKYLFNIVDLGLMTDMKTDTKKKILSVNISKISPKVAQNIQKRFGVDLTEGKITEDENPCWKGYKQIGMKEKDGKQVPNCVPIDETVEEAKKRDYKTEYKKYGSSKKSKKYRAELNKYNRQKGTYGNGDKKDASHKGGKIVGFEEQSKNRGRREKSRLKKEQKLTKEKLVEIIKDVIKEDSAGAYPEDQRKKFDKKRQKQAEVLGYKLMGTPDVKTEIDDATIKEEKLIRRLKEAKSRINGKKVKAMIDARFKIAKVIKQMKWKLGKDYDVTIEPGDYEKGWMTHHLPPQNYQKFLDGLDFVKVKYMKEGKITEAKETGIDVARRIVKNKQHEKGVDMQTANLIMKIYHAYDKNPALQKKLEKLPLKKLAQGVWRFVK